MKTLLTFFFWLSLQPFVFSQQKGPTASHYAATIALSSSSTKLLQVVEVCCEIRGSTSRGFDPGPRNGSSFEHKGEQGPGNVNNHPSEREAKPSSPNPSDNPQNKVANPTPNNPPKDPNPPLISRQQIRELIKNAPPTAISVKAEQDLLKSLQAINDLAKIMTIEQLRGLVTDDPAEALKKIIEFLTKDIGEITKNIRNLAAIQLSVITRDALNTVGELTDAGRSATDRYEQEKYFRDRIIWENIASNANKAKAKPLTIQELGLPHLKSLPLIKIMPFKYSTQEGDIFEISFSTNEVSFINAPFCEVRATFIIQYSRNSNFKKIDRIDSVTRKFEIKNWKVARQNPLVEDTKFADLSWAQNRFGKFFVRSKIIYEIDKMEIVVSNWTVLHYDFSKTIFKVIKQPLSEGFGS